MEDPRAVAVMNWANNVKTQTAELTKIVTKLILTKQSLVFSRTSQLSLSGISKFAELDNDVLEFNGLQVDWTLAATRTLSCGLSQT